MIFGGPDPLKRQYEFKQDPHTITQVVKVLTWAFIAVSVLSIISGFMQLQLLSALLITEEEAAANENRQLMVGILYLAAFVISGIAYLVWVYRVNENCHEFAAKGMEFTPGWSVGWHFVPFMNIVRPHQIMQEVYQVSQDPTNWIRKPGSSAISWWWGLVIVDRIISNIAGRGFDLAETQSALKAATAGTMASNVVGIISALLLLHMINIISTLQNNLVRGDLPEEFSFSD